MLETRNFEIRRVNDEKREVTGIAVPFDSVVEVGGYREKFERGSIEHFDGVKLFWNHDEVIGKVTRGEETDEGYEVTAVISQTNRGNEAYTLLKDGVVDKFSVGFLPVEHRMEEDTIVRTKVTLKEVSLVPFPAYEGASVMAVRSETQNTNNKEENTMSDDNKYAPESRVADIESRTEDLERKIAVLSTGDNSAPKVDTRSGGEILKAIAAGDETAKRAFTGATSADADVTRPAFVNNGLRLINENRNVLNLFSKSPLPATGNSVEYPFVSATTGTVAVQANEGDDLNYMEVAVDTATAPVKTYGGYSSLSRQAIERSDVAYLDTVLRFQALQYAKATNAAVRTALDAATTDTAAIESEDAAGWISMVIDASANMQSNLGLEPEVLLVPTSVFQTLATMVDTTGRPLFVVNGDGANTVGNADVRNRRGTIAGVPVVVDPNATNAYLLNREAITVFESPGAPYRLQDENVVNLTKDFSLYGYMAVAVTNATAAVRLTTEVA